MELPAAQVAVLNAASANDAQTTDQLAEDTDLAPETVTGAAFALEEAGLVTVEAVEHERVATTAEGETYLEDGLPEVALYRAAIDAGAASDPVSLGEVIGAAGLDGNAVDIALANFARKGYGSIDDGAVSADPDADPDADEEALALSAVADALDATEGEEDDTTVAPDDLDVGADTLDDLERRGLIERSETTDRTVLLTDDGVDALMMGVEEAQTVGQVTPELLTSGDWESAEFAEYSVEADAETPAAGRTHVLRQTVERVKDVLVGMGFSEMEGPHVDADFWINDALFMPQDHPARTHWDRFAMETPSEIDSLPDELVERVERAHREGVGQDGDGYHSPWDEEFAEALALRGHTTSLTARHLAGEAMGDLEPPQRFFSVEKGYRNDTLDATHLLEFFQIEGWVMAEELSARDLMGTFEEFYAQFGITDVQFKPHYNPYTEPSFELFGEHPETGELIEIGNSGIFREEMLEPLGVDCDVMAWGLAGERLAMLVTGAEDIRDIHGTLTDLDFLRNAEVIY
ncbi:phenylalanine--tRNA ligase subunit alpha [Salinarchaeum laminariae]|uniref:phenylalanine--tRNA ligase subunit alpha n=1 Tax=Salinarchaeum laminariae TaxID=869888 RepID=UPI0020C11393|nr:phenylalanine--tRNA ligase subunit alpha [Salinarchaeum laminariae]